MGTETNPTVLSNNFNTGLNGPVPSVDELSRPPLGSTPDAATPAPVVSAGANQQMTTNVPVGIFGRAAPTEPQPPAYTQGSKPAPAATGARALGPALSVSTSSQFGATSSGTLGQSTVTVTSKQEGGNETSFSLRLRGRDRFDDGQPMIFDVKPALRLTVPVANEGALNAKVYAEAYGQFALNGPPRNEVGAEVGASLTYDASSYARLGLDVYGRAALTSSGGETTPSAVGGAKASVRFTPAKGWQVTPAFDVESPNVLDPGGKMNSAFSVQVSKAVSSDWSIFARGGVGVTGLPGVSTTFPGKGEPYLFLGVQGKF
jgi:hypothetical protein